jgi:protein TonB
MAEGSKMESPIVWASTVGGCTKPSHQPFPEYGTEVPYTGAPTPTRKVPPAYPKAAREAGVQGTVVLAALVCEHGRVVKTRVIDSIPLLDAAATDCVRQWDFSAANIRDLRVAAWTTIPVTFSLH